jgi:hypothetical protein
VLGVYAAGAEKQQLLHAVVESRINDVGLHHQVLVDEFGRVGVIGVDATYLGSGQVNLIGLFGFEEGAHGSLVGQVEFGVGAGDDVGLALRLQRAEQLAPKQQMISKF